jgi:ribonuclease P protein component
MSVGSYGRANLAGVSARQNLGSASVDGQKKCQYAGMTGHDVACGQLTSMWFDHHGWRECSGTSSLARSVCEACIVCGARRRSVICLEVSGVSREAYLSAQQAPSSSQARFSCSHEHSCRTSSAQVPSGQGPGPSLGLIDRVRERDSFIRLRRDGVRVRTDPLWCSFVLDPELGPPQVAFAIGRTVGSAVSRNRLRRRLRSVLAHCDLPSGVYLIGARAPACELTFSDIERTTAALLVKVRRQATSSK